METITDKIGHGYLPYYRHMTKPHAMLEVGVASGAGCRMYRGLWPAATIVGIDHDSRADNPAGPLILASQLDLHLADKLQTAGWRTFDLIVDDGAHYPAETANTFHQLWPMLHPGGTYVIEDWSHADGIGADFIVQLPRMIVDGGHGIETITLTREGLAILRKEI